MRADGNVVERSRSGGVSQNKPFPCPGQVSASVTPPVSA